ncbi:MULTISPECIES: alpha/beta hydrolase family protein [unclassified Sphingomonas]|uniref:alpha/beta hydrolase family protein n=1 Tax=unclassified Sphingomonas TaxID=196159 RepID=UPI0022B33BA8|nr:S9 family peptidase [Sphingomonas sp. NIBR02145]WHU02228.1 S9 family peptidase [Sphingomonas sp. NIBR02145]
MKTIVRAAMLAASAMPAIAYAQSEDARKFGAREFIQQISLSPDGTQVAMLQPVSGRGDALMVANLETGESKMVLNSSGDPDQITSCRWASTTRLVCNIYMIGKLDKKLAFTRMVSLNADGSDLKLLSQRDSATALDIIQSGGDIIDWGPDGSNGSVLMTREFVPEYSTGSHVANAREGLAVELVDATTLKRKLVESPRGGANEYISDGHGNVRIIGFAQARNEGMLTGNYSYQYRTAGDRDWKKLGDLVSDGGGGYSGFNPYAVDRDANVVYGFDDKDGRSALYSIALDGSLTRKLVFAHPQVDVDGLVRIGRQRRVVGVSYATDKRTTEFFDPELQKLRNALGRALPGKPLVTFIDASADEKKLLLFAGGDTDPGTYYLYDKTSKQLGEVMPLRPPLAETKLASVKPVTFPAADGTQIPGYLTLPVGSDGKNLPAIVMPHGGPGSRDEWGFDWLAQFYAARGFAVLQPNFRGSTGYGDGWFQKNGFQSWRTAIGDVNDGGRWLEKQGIAAPGKLAIVGWSYGGYAALQSPALDPDLFKAIVAIAPVTDLETLRNEAQGFTSYNIVSKFIGSGPHVKEGSPAQNVQKIKAPVLMFHGDQDLNVGIGESRMMASRLRGAGKPVELVEFKGLDHQLDDDKARTQMLDKSDAFLRAALGLAAKP